MYYVKCNKVSELPDRMEKVLESRDAETSTSQISLFSKVQQSVQSLQDLTWEGMKFPRGDRSATKCPGYMKPENLDCRG